MAFTSIFPITGVPDIPIIDPAGPGPYTVPGTGSGANKRGRLVGFGLVQNAVDPVLGGGEFIYAQAPATDSTGQTISSITAVGKVATINTATSHFLLPGAQVTLSGQVPTLYSGVFTVVSITSQSTFTVNLSAVPATAATTLGTYTNGTIMPGSWVQFGMGQSAGSVTQKAALWTGTVNSGRPLGVAVSGLLANQYGWFQVGGTAIASVYGGSVDSPLYWYASSGLAGTTASSGKQILGAQCASATGAVVGSGASAITLPSFSTTSCQALVYLNRPYAQGAIT
jgi:hypothetical protein